MSKELDDIYKKICRLTGEKPSSKVNKKDSVLKGLATLEKTLKGNQKLEEENTKRINEILKVVVSFANLKYEKKAYL